MKLMSWKRKKNNCNRNTNNKDGEKYYCPFCHVVVKNIICPYCGANLSEYAVLAERIQVDKQVTEPASTECKENAERGCQESIRESDNDKNISKNVCTEETKTMQDNLPLDQNPGDFIEIVIRPDNKSSSLYYSPSKKILISGADYRKKTLRTLHYTLGFTDAIARIFNSSGNGILTRSGYLAIQEVKKIWPELNIGTMLLHRPRKDDAELLFTIDETTETAGMEFYNDSHHAFLCHYSMNGEDLGCYYIGRKETIDLIMMFPEEQRETNLKKVIDPLAEKSTLGSWCKKDDAIIAEPNESTMQKLVELTDMFFKAEICRNTDAEREFMLLVYYLFRGRTNLVREIMKRGIMNLFPEGTSCPQPGKLNYLYDSGYRSSYDGGCGGGESYDLEIHVEKLSEGWYEAIARYAGEPWGFGGGFEYIGRLPFGESIEVYTNATNGLLLKEPCGLDGVYLINF